MSDVRLVDEGESQYAVMAGDDRLGTVHKTRRPTNRRRFYSAQTRGQGRTVWLASRTDEEFTSRPGAVADVVKRGGRAVI